MEVRILSKLEQLINELCPDGVEYKKIKAAFQRLKGTPITAGKMKEISSDDGDVRVFAGGKTVINAKENDILNANIITVPAVLVQSRGVIDVVYFDRPFTFKNEMWAYTTNEKITVKYLYYVLKNNIQHFRDMASGMGSLPQISLPVTEEFRIPLPPLPVQEEIVRILDNFTELTAELTAELTVRKQQYEYYCKQILNQMKHKTYIPIRKLGKWVGGGTPSMSNDEFWANGEIPWISSKDMKVATLIDTQNHITKKALKKTSLRLLPPNTVAIVARSGILKHTLPVVFIPFEATVNQDIKALISDCSFLPRFSFFVIFAYRNEILNKTKKQGGTVDSLDMDAFYNYEVPISSIKEEQERVIAILDRFDKLCNDISEGLPAEIKARQQQYEYYRDKLLTFKEKEVCVNE